MPNAAPGIGSVLVNFGVNVLATAGFATISIIGTWAVWVALRGWARRFALIAMGLTIYPICVGFTLAVWGWR